MGVSPYKVLSDSFNILLKSSYPKGKEGNADKWQTAKNLANEIKKNPDVANDIFDAIALSNPSGFKYELKSTIYISDSEMSTNEILKGVTKILRVALDSGDVKAIKDMAPVLDQLQSIYRPKEENKVTAINVSVVDYSDIPEEYALETGTIQDYTGLMGDDWATEAWGLISPMPAKERIEWAKERGIFPSQVQSLD